jgi:hypothetical protein
MATNTETMIDAVDGAGRTFQHDIDDSETSFPASRTRSSGPFSLHVPCVGRMAGFFGCVDGLVEPLSDREANDEFQHSKFTGYLAAAIPRVYYGVNYFCRNFFPDTTNTAIRGTIIGYGGSGSPNTNNRTISASVVRLDPDLLERPHVWGSAILRAIFVPDSRTVVRGSGVPQERAFEHGLCRFPLYSCRRRQPLWNAWPVLSEDNWALWRDPQ